eukprot:4389873-Ditylum_brightwellii.AAC.1
MISLAHCPLHYHILDESPHADAPALVDHVLPLPLAPALGDCAPALIDHTLPPPPPPLPTNSSIPLRRKNSLFCHAAFLLTHQGTSNPLLTYPKWSCFG